MASWRQGRGAGYFTRGRDGCYGKCISWLGLNLIDPLKKESFVTSNIPDHEAL